ncbi:MAG: sugar phosphate isomerase/epimerase family protein [Chryseolinea sp.]
MSLQKNHLPLWLTVTVSTVLAVVLATSSAPAQKKDKPNSQAPVIAALNAFSFNDLLAAKDNRTKQQVYNLFNLLDWCHTKNIKAVDPTAYFFPTYPEVPSDEYLKKFKEEAKSLGVVISGTGVRNNFASPDPHVRAEGVALTKKWIEAASKMGAPIVRVFAGEIPKGYEDKWTEVAGWMIECFKECAAYGEKFGVKIGIQNHGDMLQTADQCMYVLKAVNSKWAGLIVDIGSFKTEDPYKDIEAVVPYAINWQVKESVFGLGSTVQTDYVKLMKIIKKGGYKGYLPIETLSEKDKPYDPFERVQNMMTSLNNAIDEVYK